MQKIPTTGMWRQVTCWAPGLGFKVAGSGPNGNPKTLDFSRTPALDGALGMSHRVSMSEVRMWDGHEGL